MKEILNTLDEAMDSIARNYYGDAKWALSDAERFTQEKNLDTRITESLFQEIRETINSDTAAKTVYRIATVSRYLMNDYIDRNPEQNDEDGI